MDAELIVFEGGPLDGQRDTYPAGIGLLAIPVQVEGDEVETVHQYSQADWLNPEDRSFDSEGARRYLYQGPA